MISVMLANAPALTIVSNLNSKQPSFNTFRNSNNQPTHIVRPFDAQFIPIDIQKQSITVISLSTLPFPQKRQVGEDSSGSLRITRPVAYRNSLHEHDEILHHTTTTVFFPANTTLLQATWKRHERIARR